MSHIDHYRMAVETMRQRPELMQFVGPRTEAMISKSEQSLSMTFPSDYRRFLSEFGAGSFGAFEIYGITPEQFPFEAVPNGIWVTLCERIDSSLPRDLVAVGSDGSGGLYCIRNGAGPVGKSPVVLFTPGMSSSQDVLQVIASDFAEYFLTGVREQVERNSV